VAGLLEESVLSGLVLLFSCQAWIELLVCLLLGLGLGLGLGSKDLLVLEGVV
jgi:hypothetical protein